MNIVGLGPLALDVKPSDSIRTVKARIRSSHPFLRNDIHLCYNEWPLEGDDTIGGCGIQHGDYLQAIVLLSGGGEDFGFDFNSCRDKEILQFGPGPEYRRVRRGINFKSICLNSECEAYNKEIYIPKGFGEFSIAEITVNLCCPVCKVRAKESKNCGFYRAKWTFKGYSNEVGSELEWGDSSDKEVLYTFKEGSDTNWRYLKVTVEEL